MVFAPPEHVSHVALALHCRESLLVFDTAVAQFVKLRLFAWYTI